MEFQHEGWTVSIKEKLDAPRGASISAPGDLPKEPRLNKVMYAYFNDRHGFPLRARTLEDAKKEAIQLIDSRMIDALEMQKNDKI